MIKKVNEIIAQPKWTKTQFLDHIGDDTIAEFIAQVDTGDMEAKVFQFKLLMSGDVIDTAKQSVSDGIEWLENNALIPSFTETKRKKIKGE